MEKAFDYVISEIQVPKIVQTNIEDFDFNDIDSSVLRVVVTPFDDLKESFDRLIQNKINYLCINTLAIIDVVSLAEKIINCTYESIEYVFVSYSNFDIARANVVNNSPILDSIEHIVAFMISSKFVALKKTICSVIEFLMTCEDYVVIYHVDDISRVNYANTIRNNTIVKIIKLEEV